MLLKIDSIKINERLREVSIDKVTEIAASIKEIGLLNPITVTENNELIAGNHRLEAFRMLGFQEIPVNVVPLSGLKQELAEIDENLIRNDLHYIDLGEHLKERKRIFELLHPETIKGISQAIGMNKAVGNDVSADTAVTSFVEDTAKKTNMSSRVIHENIQIASLNKEVKDKIKEADLSKTDALKIARLQPEKQKQVMDRVIENKEAPKEAMKEIYKEELQEARKQKQITKTIELPTTEFNIILADPPWQYSPAEPTRRIENQYPTMADAQIYGMKIPSSKDCILFLWATTGKLPEALKTMEAWGFQYKSSAIWNKMMVGMGYYFRGQHEFLLVGTKGNPGTPGPENRYSSVIEEKRTEHSKKPDIVYEMIEKMYPDRKYLEMFARNKREGWESWGNEV
jgi:ParB/RepB/Spo0J family partition protein